MKNYIFGYARVSTEAQNLDRQLDVLKKYGVDLIELTELFHDRGVNLVSLKEAIDTNTSTGKLLYCTPLPPDNKGYDDRNCSLGISRC